MRRETVYPSTCLRVNSLNHNKVGRQGICRPEAASVTSEDKQRRLRALVWEKHAQAERAPSSTPPPGSLWDPFAPPCPMFLIFIFSSFPSPVPPLHSYLRKQKPLESFLTLPPQTTSFFPQIYPWPALVPFPHLLPCPTTASHVTPAISSLILAYSHFLFWVIWISTVSS